MKLSLSMATAETTTLPNHRQTKQFLIILQNNGWHEIQIPWPLKVTSRSWTCIKCSFSSQTNPLSTGWTWSQSNFPPKTRLNSCLLLSRSQLKSSSTQSQVCVTLCVTQTLRCGSSLHSCGWYKQQIHLSGNMAPLCPYSKTGHDGNCLNTICVISLTHLQHFLLLDF